MISLKPNKRIAFVHVPKCGGNSLHKAFKDSLETGAFDWRIATIRSRATYLKALKLNLDPLDHRQDLVRGILKSSFKSYIKGHFRCDDSCRGDFDNKWHFVTVLRNPVDRWFSEYFFNVHKEFDHRKINISLESFLESDFGIRNASKFVDFFTDGIHLSDDTGMRQAIENLEKFSAVGILENLDPFEKTISKLIGRSFGVTQTVNRNPLSKKEMQSEISQEVLKKVTELCKRDLKIYDHFKDKIVSQ